MLKSRSAFRTLAKNRSNSPLPSSRQGRLFPPSGRISVSFLLGSNLLLRPVELGSIDPHAMQRNRTWPTRSRAEPEDGGNWDCRSRPPKTDSIVPAVLAD